MRHIGSPPQSVASWLESFARDNDQAAADTWLPWTKAKHRGQSWAFRTAANLVRRAEESEIRASNEYAETMIRKDQRERHEGTSSQRRDGGTDMSVGGTTLKPGS